MVLEAVEFMLDSGFQFFSGTVEGKSESFSFVSDGDGRETFEAGFHHAAFVLGAALFAVLVIEVHFDAGDVAADVAEGVRDGGLGLSDEILVARDVMVGVDLDDHGVFGVFMPPTRLRLPRGY
jgi:hypothetical protein